MLEVEVSTSGLEFEEFAGEVEGELRQELVERLGQVAFERMLWGAPIRSGYLASTIVEEVGNFEAWVRVLAEYAIFVVKGTRPHEIVPVNAKALAFEGPDGLVFARLVNHPGTKPNPFVEEAAQYTQERVSEVFETLWQEQVGG